MQRNRINVAIKLSNERFRFFKIIVAAQVPNLERLAHKSDGFGSFLVIQMQDSNLFHHFPLFS